MIRKLSFTALALLSSTAAAASPDARIRSVAYDPNGIVRVVGKTGIQSTIEFGADEQIENVAVGDSSKWQITPNRRASLLFVKPLSARSRTNMTVVTDKRTYMFDLVAGDTSTAPLYAMKFSYPHERLAQPAATPAQEAAVTAPRPVETAPMVAERLHFDWNSKGNAKLLPGRAFDDGASLYLAWKGETPLPAILTVSEDRKEGPLNYQMSGEYIVISPVPQNIVLRYGNKSAAMWPSRRIVPPVGQRPAGMSTRIAASLSTQQQQQVPPQAVQTQPVQAVSPAAAPPPTTVKLANVSTLFTDKLTDNRNEH